MYPFIFKIIYYYVDKTESLSTCLFLFGVIYLSSHIFSKLLFCRQFCWQGTLWAVIFSQNCCFVSNFVDDSNMRTCMQTIIFQHHPLMFCWLLLFLFIIQWASLNILHVTLFFKSNYHFVWTFTHQQEWLARYVCRCILWHTHFLYLLLVNDFSCLSFSEHHINTFYILQCFSKAIIISSGTFTYMYKKD